MEPTKIRFPLALTYDDILLVPHYSAFSRKDIDISTRFTKKITLASPFVAAPMDTIAESKLAIALALMGGIAVIHRNLSAKDQAEEVEKTKKKKLLVAAAVGASPGYMERVIALVKAGADAVVVDSAHGFSKGVIEAVSAIKNKFQNLEVIGGNISTADGAKTLIKAGSDGLRVGMGPGAICTTRVISGMGVPQATALLDVCGVASKFDVPVIADGGIKYSGDMVKALALGSSTVMMGNLFAATLEAPGKVVKLKREEVPQRFLSIFNHNKSEYLFKEYRAMGSIGAMERGAKIKSEDEFHGKSYKERVLVAEGVEGLVPVKGTVKEFVDQISGGIKSGMYYVGAKSIRELWKKAEFMQITQASLTESHPHSILITNPGKNY